MTFTGTLLPYQEEAVETMAEKKKILVAYDLGLGKTVITIAACEELIDRGEIEGPVLVVVLASLKYQWAKEIHKFSDSDVTVIDGTKAQRQKQIQAVDTTYVITNYESVVNDWDLLKVIPFGAIVMDEATAIKGFRSKRAKRVKEISKKVDVRFALTGTPVENGKPEEIFSIMQAVDERLLGRFDLFDATFIVRNPYFGGVERYRNLDLLHERLSKNLIRKTQSDPDVSPFMPDTIHRDPALVSLDKKLWPLYDSIALDLMEGLEEAIGTFGSSWSLAAHYGHAASNQPGMEEMGLLMSQITLLRQICSHPHLVIESADKFAHHYERAQETGILRTGGSHTAWKLLEDDPSLRQLLESARIRKLDTLEDMVKDHLSSDDEAKLVVFTTFLLTADKIQQRLGGVTYSGQMSAVDKERAKEQFQTDPNTRVLISTDAGGYGVDLPQANLLINYDLPWSAGRAVQRNGRIRRASSRWPTVVIQDLLVVDSIEVRQHQLLTQKSGVAGAVVDGVGINKQGGIDLSAGSLLEHLRLTVGLPN